MLNGTGTETSPLLSLYSEFMDISIMKDVQEGKEAIVLVLRDIEQDELYAISFPPDNFLDLLEKGKALYDSL